MKRLTTAFFSVFFMLLLTLCVSGVDYSGTMGVGELEDSLPQSAREVLGDLKSDDAAESGLDRLWQYASDRLSEVLKEALRPAMTTLAVTLLCSCLAGLEAKSGGFDYVSFGGCLAVSGVCFSDMSSVFVSGRKAMDELLAFSHAMLPTLCVSAAAAGSAGGAGEKYAASVMFLDVLMSAETSIIFPLISAYALMASAAACLGSEQLKAVSKMLKSAVRFVLVLLVMVFTLYLSLTGLVASSADVLATKAAKTALSTFVPVVGGIISDAAGSVVAGAGIVRACVGAFGLVAVLAVCLLPFMRLGARLVLFRLSGALALSCASDRLSGLISAAADACALVLAAVGAEAVFLFISIISMAKAVGA